MRILMISAEAPPLHRAGALVDVLDALPHELRERGHEVSVVLPFYREIRENNELEINDTGITVDIRVGEKITSRNIWKAGPRAGYNYFLFVATNFSIALKFTANMASPTKTTPLVLSFSTRPPSNWRDA